MKRNKEKKAVPGKQKAVRPRSTTPIDAEALFKAILSSDLDDPLPLNEWLDALIWCPSQCYYRTQKDGVDYVLCLRWRWEDPWQGFIVKNAITEKDLFRSQAENSPDLFEQYGLFFEADQLEEAKSKLIELFEQATFSPTDMEK